MFKKFKYFLPLIVFIAVMVSFAKNLSLDKKPISNVIGKKADLSTLVSINDPSQQLNFKRNEPIIIHFFSSWCSTCHLDHEKILKIKQRHKLKVVGVLWQDDLDRIKQWQVKNPNIYDSIAFDPSDRIIVQLGVVGIPETFIISKDKTILFNEKGELSQEELLNALHIELAKQ